MSRSWYNFNTFWLKSKLIKIEADCILISLASLHSRITFFMGSDSAPHAPPFSSTSCHEPRRKELQVWASRPEWAHVGPKSHVSLSLQRGDSSVVFIREDQCPFSRASSIVLFGGYEEDDGDDAMSLAASDTEEWSKPAEDPATLMQSEPDDFRSGLESKLIRVLSKAIEELGLDWPSPHAQPPWVVPAARVLPVGQRLAQFSRKYTTSWLSCGAHLCDRGTEIAEFSNRSRSSTIQQHIKPMPTSAQTQPKAEPGVWQHSWRV